MAIDFGHRTTSSFIPADLVLTIESSSLQPSLDISTEFDVGLDYDSEARDSDPIQYPQLVILRDSSLVLTFDAGELGGSVINALFLAILC